MADLTNYPVYRLLSDKPHRPECLTIPQDMPVGFCVLLQKLEAMPISGKPVQRRDQRLSHPFMV